MKQPSTNTGWKMLPEGVLEFTNPGIIHATTDSHLGHKNIIEYCNRPKDYESQILNSWRVLMSHDTLVHFGDFCFQDKNTGFGREYWHAILRREVECKKILLRGNHDREPTSWYLDQGWDHVADRAIMTTVQGQRVVLSHRPLEIYDIHQTHKCEVNIHGHFHNFYDNMIGQAWSQYHYLFAVEHHGYAATPLYPLAATAVREVRAVREALSKLK